MMFLGSEYYEIYSAALEAHERRRYAEAAILFERCCRMAKEAGAEDSAFRVGIDAARSFLFAGDPKQALTRLLELEHWDAPSGRATWYMKSAIFETLFEYYPALDPLKRRLGELESLAYTFLDAPGADYFLNRCMLFGARGLDVEALEALEIGWTKRGEGQLSHSHSIASQAIHYCLALERDRQAQDWLEALREEGEDDCLRYHLDLARAKACHALSQGNIETCLEWTEEVDRRADEFQLSYAQRSAKELRVRALLLDFTQGDPLESTHPLRRYLSQPLLGRPSSEERYSRRLLFGDLRLAAVRWALGVPPVDDLYYRQPQAAGGAPQLEEEEIARRAVKTRCAYRAALYAAEELDRAFECSFRQDTIRNRLRRLDQLTG